MFDLLGIIVEGIIDVVSDIFEDGDIFEGGADSAPVIVDGQAALPAAPTDISGGIGAASLDPGSSSAGSWLAATDGGIAADRFDPKPIPGPFSPSD